MDEFVVRAIREEERQECLDLWCTVWAGKESPVYFRRYFYGDIEWLPYYTQVGLLNGRIVSAVQICKRIVACGDLRLTMGGIANVATLPEFRGRGYNSQCLASAVAVMEADAMDFSLLFTGINDYYARQGFSTLTRTWVSGHVARDFVPGAQTMRVRQATAEDLEAIRSCYDGYNRHRPIAVQRTPAYWRDWIEIYLDHIPSGLLVAIAENGALNGYIRTGVFKSAIAYSADAVEARIIEFGMQPDLSDTQQYETALALLQAVIAEMPSGGDRVLRLDIARDPVVEKAIDRLFDTKTEHTNHSGMVRLLHRDYLLRSVAIGLNERWIAAGRPSGVLHFQTPYGDVTLDAEGALLRVRTDSESKNVTALPQSALFMLLFGMATPDQVCEEKSLFPLIATLFPPQAAIYYGADGF